MTVVRLFEGETMILELHGDRGDLEGRIDFAGDDKKIFRVVPLDLV